MNPVEKQTQVNFSVVSVKAEDSGNRRSPDSLVEGSRENLSAVFTEAETGDTFTMSALIPPQTLTALNLPHLDKQYNPSINL